MSGVAPSILAADFANLARDVAKMEEAGARMIHVDVMDGHFVPNITAGPPLVKALRRCTDLLLDVHLMITHPEQFIGAFIEAGADWLSVHYEATVHLDRLLDEIRRKGVHPGVAINPQTPVLLLEDTLHKCHHVLVMSVNPGFGGQQFIANSLHKVRKLKAAVEARSIDVKIEIDGGIGLENVREVVESGVDVVVAGSSIFHSHSPGEAFRQMQTVADEVSALKNDFFV